MEIINKIDKLDSLLFTMLYISPVEQDIYDNISQHHKRTIFKDIYQPGIRLCEGYRIQINMIKLEVQLVMSLLYKQSHMCIYKL